MSATVETPIIPGPIQGPTREEPLIEALLLDDYRALVHLAYLILPPAISRARRVAAAHAVVQGAVPPGLAVPAIEPREVLRRRVVALATRRAAERTILERVGSVFAPKDDLGFDPCALTVDRTTLRRRSRRGARVATATALAVAAALLLALLT
ncbi:hypothetical protein AB0E69_30990 [Kribbella sp. NPDC026611]|uniref:hypothetical protein n=1 Tax=Kribbella sp. NPDC026611 TaxID=3154911 RepID=UPI0033EE737E